MGKGWLTTIVLLFALLPCARAQVIDRLVATVNGSPLLESDLDNTLRFEMLRQGRALSSANEADRRSAFEHLLERELVRQQMQSLYTPTSEEMEHNRQAIRGIFPSAKNDKGWQQLLAAYGIDSARLDVEIIAQLQTLRFVEDRLRPNIKIERAEVESYYSEKLVPQLKAMGETPEPLVLLAPRIRELLSEEKINQLFFQWIRELRGESLIDLRVSDAGLATIVSGKDSEENTNSKPEEARP